MTPFRSLSNFSYGGCPGVRMQKQNKTSDKMSNRNKYRRRGKNKASKSQSAINSTVHPDAGGIDVGAEELVVAIPPGRDPTGCVHGTRA